MDHKHEFPDRKNKRKELDGKPDGTKKARRGSLYLRRHLSLCFLCFFYHANGEDNGRRRSISFVVRGSQEGCNVVEKTVST
jgi:hypothetical protein